MASRKEALRSWVARALDVIGGVLAVAGIIGVLVPIIYLLYGCVFWLQHGTWLDWDLCAALGPALGCPFHSEWVGLNQVVQWLLEHPFAASCVLGLASWMVFITISDGLVKLATAIRGKPAGGELEGDGEPG